MLKEKRKKKAGGVGKWEKVTATTEAGNAKKKKIFFFLPQSMLALFKSSTPE